jgi:hypothetical protein
VQGSTVTADSAANDHQVIIILGACHGNHGTALATAAACGHMPTDHSNWQSSQR